MSERRRWDLYVRDMLQACERVAEAADGSHQGENPVNAILDLYNPAGSLVAAVP